MKNLQALCIDSNSKIVEQVVQEKAAKENLNFLFDLATNAMVVDDIMSMKNELWVFYEAWNHSNPESQKKMARGHTKRVE